MNFLDFLILIPILFFAYRGFVNGLVKEVLSIVGIVLAVFLTFKFMDLLSELLRPLFSEDDIYVPIVSATVLFIGTLLIVHFIAHIIQKALEAINLQLLNRFFGTTFGALKSSIVISAALLLLAGFDLPDDDVREESLTYPYIIYVAPFAYDSIAGLKPGSDNFTETFERALGEYNPIQKLSIFQDSDS